MLVAIVAVSIALTACGGGEPIGSPDITPSTSLSDPVVESESATTTSTTASSTTGVPADAPIEFVGEPLTLAVGETTYWLGEDTSGCVSLLISTEGEFYVESQRCERGLTGGWDDVVDCAYRPPLEIEDPKPNVEYALPECEVEVPTVSFGHSWSGIDLLCLAPSTRTSLGPVQFATLSNQGLYLLPGPEVGHRYGIIPYTADGRRYGSPSGGWESDVEALCSVSGPWAQPAPAAQERRC